MKNEKEWGAPMNSATPTDHYKVTELFAYTQTNEQQKSLADISSGNAIERTGIMSVMPVNDWIDRASCLPMPQAIWGGIIYENEVTCLFSDTNTGKTILAVQIADEVANNGLKALYVDFELSDRQFAMRYMDEHTRHEFSQNFYRAELAQYEETDNFEKDAFNAIRDCCQKWEISFVVVDNLTWLNANAEKGDAAAELMKDLISLKRDHNLTVLVVSHTPKRRLDQPITQNDLGGSKRIANFLDAMIAIGTSAKDPNWRYIKQVKCRNGAYTYDTDNVLLCEILKGEDAFTHFEVIGTAAEYEHLTDRQAANNAIAEDILQLHKQGKSVREIERVVPASRSKIHRIISNSKVSHVLSHDMNETTGTNGTPNSEQRGGELL